MRSNARTLVASLAMVTILLIAVSCRSTMVSATAAAAPPEPFVPPAAGCQAEPRTVEGLLELFASAEPVDHPTVETSAVVPLGESAPVAVSTAIKAVIGEVFSCLNAGEMLRFLGLMTDQVVLVNFPWIVESLSEDELPEEVTNPQALPPDLQQTILAIGDVSLFADGRAGAVVSFVDPVAEDSEVEVLYLVFAYQDEQWLIDDAFEL
jgi:hypothetical protein